MSLEMTLIRYLTVDRAQELIKQDIEAIYLVHEPSNTYMSFEMTLIR